jgi:hypothetical protein
MYLNAEVYIMNLNNTNVIKKEIIAGGYTLATSYAHNFMADNDVTS